MGKKKGVVTTNREPVTRKEVQKEVEKPRKRHRSRTPPRRAASRDRDEVVKKPEVTTPVVPPAGLPRPFPLPGLGGPGGLPFPGMMPALPGAPPSLNMLGMGRGRALTPTPKEDAILPGNSVPTVNVPKNSSSSASTSTLVPPPGMPVLQLPQITKSTSSTPSVADIPPKSAPARTTAPPPVSEKKTEEAKKAEDREKSEKDHREKAEKSSRSRSPRRNVVTVSAAATTAPVIVRQAVSQIPNVPYILAEVGNNEKLKWAEDLISIEERRALKLGIRVGL